MTKRIMCQAIVETGNNLARLNNIGGKLGLNGHILLDNYYQGDYIACINETKNFILLTPRDRIILDKAIIASYDLKRKHMRKKYKELMYDILPRVNGWQVAIVEVFKILELHDMNYIIPSIQDVWRLNDEILKSLGEVSGYVIPTVDDLRRAYR